MYSDVRVEPDLQPVTHNQLDGASANSQDGARLDLSANGVWGGRYEKTFFDVWIFSPIPPSNRGLIPAAAYRKHECEKKRAYEHVREVEHSSFTPLVLSASGGMGTEATIFYKRLATLLADKWDSHYSNSRCYAGYAVIWVFLYSGPQFKLLEEPDLPGGMLRGHHTQQWT